MKKLLVPGRNIFAIGFLALGFLCFVYKDFIVGRPPEWPSTVKVNPALGYISGAALIFSALGIILNQKAKQAALLIAALILVFSVFRHFGTFMTTWPNAYKSIAFVGGCFVIASSYDLIAGDVLRKQYLVTAGTLMLALFLIVGGYSHFKYADFVDTLIPAYIPFHRFWTYFCGVCLLAGGVGVVIPVTRSLASVMCAIVIGGWFLLLHIPRFFANMNDASDRMGLCESFIFVGMFMVLASITNRTKQN